MSFMVWKRLRRTSRGWLFCLLTVAYASAPCAPVSAEVLWEDYQGTTNITGLSGQDKPGPAYSNATGTTAQKLTALRAIASNVSNATRTGSDATIDYFDTSVLCNTGGSGSVGYDPAGIGSACLADAMGRVLYALMKFPNAGKYQFEVAHDDEMEMALSTNYTSTAYRTATYNIPVGSKGGFSGENIFVILGSVYAPTANSCAIVRVLWNNGGGGNALRLRWDRPGVTGEVVPASQLANPSQSSSSIGCTGSVTMVGEITLQKAVAASGRIYPADQFIVETVDNSSGSVLASATTSGSGTGTQASTGATPVGAGIVYRLTDAMATGSTNTLAAYVPTIACTRNGTPFTPSGAAPTWTTSAAANDAVVCTITNTRAPPVTVSKVAFPIYDPVNITTNPKFVPGGALQYRLTIANPGPALTTNTLVIVDPLPANLRMFVGNISGSGKPVVFTEGSPASTLTFTYTNLSSTTDDVDFSNNGGTSWTYVPVPDGQNYDAAVTNIRIRPKGSMAPGSSANFLFQVALD